MSWWVNQEGHVREGGPELYEQGYVKLPDPDSSGYSEGAKVYGELWKQTGLDTFERAVVVVRLVRNGDDPAWESCGRAVTFNELAAKIKEMTGEE
ncbi:hypothetical protein [Rubrobacter calidifluminis]|uniref:hypothetical protein n=1 Tax=Rubrobacter calidifluminis TaxID=1392640 RepID=UPI00235E0B21|nr:hypothetical protein [Rubrobacter calidifluminis]